MVHWVRVYGSCKNIFDAIVLKKRNIVIFVWSWIMFLVFAHLNSFVILMLNYMVSQRAVAWKIKNNLLHRTVIYFKKYLHSNLNIMKKISIVECIFSPLKRYNILCSLISLSTKPIGFSILRELYIGPRTTIGYFFNFCFQIQSP